MAAGNELAQKNEEVVRHFVGYRSYDKPGAATALAALYRSTTRVVRAGAVADNARDIGSIAKRTAWNFSRSSSANVGVAAEKLAAGCGTPSGIWGKAADEKGGFGALDGEL